MALSFGIPVCIVSDNDGNTKTEIESQLRKIERNTSLILSEKNLHVSYLSPSNDIEAELIHVVGMRQEIIEALINTETRGGSNAAYNEAKTREIEALSDDELLKRMRSSKASYAGFLADVILRNPNNKTVEQLIPQAVIDTFTQLKGWG